MNLVQALENIKQRPQMYFCKKEPSELYSFLLGWDMASGTEWGLKAIEHISKIKKTGSLVPDSTHVSFDEALDIIISLVIDIT
jgi:hypothetical protein